MIAKQYLGSIFLEDYSPVIPVNCVGVTGKGLAKEWATRFPLEAAEYRALCSSGTLKPGHPAILKSGTVVFPTKNHWKGNSKIQWIEEGLERLAEMDIDALAFPLLGAGLGGLNPNLVIKTIKKALTTHEFLEESIIVYTEDYLRTAWGGVLVIGYSNLDEPMREIVDRILTKGLRATTFWPCTPLPENVVKLDPGFSGVSMSIALSTFYIEEMPELEDEYEKKKIWRKQLAKAIKTSDMIVFVGTPDYNPNEEYTKKILSSKRVFVHKTLDTPLAYLLRKLGAKSV